MYMIPPIRKCRSSSVVEIGILNDTSVRGFHPSYNKTEKYCTNDVTEFFATLRISLSNVIVSEAEMGISLSRIRCKIYLRRNSASYISFVLKSLRWKNLR
ncbi:hypothetical protein J6590_050788 [Homalodisca vitripennis]|nr:hypothetical protein J6590_050788 [Homalodisca vitripennis]